MIVVLTPWEVWYASKIGTARQVSNMQNRRVQKYGAKFNEWENHIYGAIGELGVAKALGRPWTAAYTLDNFAVPDVGPYQVRATSNPRGRLIVHRPQDGDKPEAAFVGTRVIGFEVHVDGWMYGHEAQQPQFWQDPGKNNRPAYFIEAGLLSGLDTLPL